MFLGSALVAGLRQAALKTAPSTPRGSRAEPLVLNRGAWLKTSEHNKSIGLEIRPLASRTLGSVAVVRRQPNRSAGAGNGLDRGDEFTRSTSQPRTAKPGY